MPNWVFNTLTIQGPKEQVDNIKSTLNTPFTREHENWSIEKQAMVSETYTYSNPVFAFWNIIRPTDLVEYAKQPAHDLANGNDWYSWNYRNWGTKWDVAVSDTRAYDSTELLEHRSRDNDNWLVYRFDTAWSPPIPALIKLSSMVPNCVVTLSWQEEQGFGGEVEFVNGEITANSEYESRCMDCDKYDTLEWCEEECGNICSSCNYLGEANLDQVAECDTHKVFLDKEHLPNYRWDKLDVSR
jgi:hypothetical protein